MRITWRDTMVTVLVAAVAVPYAGFVARGSMPFIHDGHGMSAVGLVLGAVAAAVIGPVGSGGRGALGRDAATFGLLSLATGVAALARADTGMVGDVLLLAFVGTMVLRWALAVAHDVRHRRRISAVPYGRT